MNKIDEKLEALSIWDKVEALEYLGIELNLTEEEQIEIAGLKAQADKKEEFKNEKENKARISESMKNMMGGVDFQEVVEKIFKKN